jgi:hypothetical protein
MSAQYGAPGIRRPSLAAPSPPIMRRKALFVAAATLCAPAFATLALAAFAATGGSDQPAMGSLAGTRGLNGTTTPEVIAPAPTRPDRGPAVKSADQRDDASNPAPQVQKHPVSQAPPSSPVQHAPTPPTRTPTKPTHPAPAPHVNSPAVPPYDPSQPGAPNTSGGTTGTDGSSSGSTSGSGTTTTTTSGSGSSGHGGNAEYNTYSGGG